MNKTCLRCGAAVDPTGTLDGMCAKCVFTGAMGLGGDFPETLMRSSPEAPFSLPGLTDVELLGRGGMGAVYRARQAALGRTVAVKVLAESMVADPEFQERFGREARTLAALDHPNIVTVHDFGAAGDLRYIVMEYVDGATLRSEIGSRGIEPTRALRILTHVGRALGYAHARGVVHRDIKPENILIRADDAIKVADFGIARLVGAAQTTALTASGAVIGTPAYMAPEQRDDPLSVDHRADIYALGVLAYEMLTGEIPVGTVPPPSKRVDVDERVDDIVMRAMERDPDARFQTVESMLEALAEVTEPEAATTRTGPRRLPVRQRIARLRRSRLFWILATGSAFLLLTLGSRLAERVPPDPEALFDRLLATDSWPDQEAIAAELRDERIVEAFDRVLTREAEGGDSARATAAFRIAYALGRLDSIPPQTRVRILLDWGDEHELHFGFMMQDPTDPEIRGALLMAAADAGGSPLARVLYAEMVGGRLDPGSMRAAAKALGRIATIDEVREMHRFILQNPAHAATPELLYALANRVDLPLPIWHGEVEPDVCRLYLERLPALLDLDLGRARFQEAARLAQELREWELRTGNEFTTGAIAWESEFGSGDPSLPAAQALAAHLRVPWPIDEAAAARLESDILTRKDMKNAYAKALLLRWRTESPGTLPWYPHPPVRHDEFGLPPMGHHWGAGPAKAILSAQGDPDSTRWRAFALLIRTIAGEPVLMGTAEGKGAVSATIAGEVSSVRPTQTLHLGMTPAVPKAATSSMGTYTAKLTGAFRHDDRAGPVFEGNLYESFGGGSGGGTAGGNAVPGEALLLDIGLKGSRRGDLRYGTFVLLIAEPPDGEDAERAWRSALARSMERAEGGMQGSSMKRMLALSAWIPLSEARGTLERIWDRRDGLDGDCPYLDAPLADVAGAALLMAGGDAPLVEPGLLDRLPADVVLRLYLHSPSEVVRHAISDRVRAPELTADAEAVIERLDARGETGTAAAKAARAVAEAGRAARRADALGDFAPYAVGALIVLAVGWLPWPGKRPAAVAHALIYSGFVLHFFTLEAAGRIWIPVAGDVLIAAGAFLFGGWTIRSLASALALGGILQLMAPSSPQVVFGAMLLFCAFVAVFSLDLLARRLPARIRPLESVALLATWWALVLPIGIVCVAGLVLSTTREEFEVNLFNLEGGWAMLYLAAMIAGPLWLVRSEARRLAGSSAQSVDHSAASSFFS